MLLGGIVYKLLTCFFRFCLYIDHLLVYIWSHCTGQGCDPMQRQLPLACRLVSVYPGQRVDFAHSNLTLIGVLHRLVYINLEVGISVIEPQYELFIRFDSI